MLPRSGPLRIDAFRRLWLSSTLMFLAVQTQAVVRGIRMYELTGRASGLGAALLCFGLASVALLPVGGVVADRAPRRRVLGTSVTILVTTSAAMTVVELVGAMRSWMLLAMAVVHGGASSFWIPARLGLALDIVDPLQQPGAIALSQLSLAIGGVSGPAMAAVLLAQGEHGGTLAFGVSAMLGACGLVLLLRVPPVPAGRSTRSAFGELVAGFEYVRDHRTLRLLSAGFVVALSLGLNYSTFIPAIVQGQLGLGRREVGLVAAAAAVGGVVASIAMAASAHVRAERARLLAIAGGVAVSFAVFGHSRNLREAAVGAAVAGAASAALQTVSMAIALARTEPGYLGRVQSVVFLGVSGYGLASFPLGWAMDRWSPSATLLWAGIGAAAVLAASTVVLQPDVSSIDR